MTAPHLSREDATPLPCPFCGEAVEAHDYLDKPRAACVILHRCRAIGPISLESYDMSNLIERWNTRADHADALTQRVERLTEALQRMVYETTSLSPLEDDGSHWCKISAEALAHARAALPPEAGE